MKPFDGMPTVGTPEASRTLAKVHPGILPSPLRNWVGNFNHVRFRGYLSVHFRFGLQSPCLRFAVDVTGHHARLGTWPLARLYQGSHLRPLNFMRLQGAILTAPGSEAMSLGATRCACRHPTTVTILCLNPLDSMETPPHKAMVGCDETRESHRRAHRYANDHHALIRDHGPRCDALRLSAPYDGCINR